MAAAIDVRSRVVENLHPTVADLIRATDALEAVMRAPTGATVRRAVARLVRARDAYLAPLVARAAEGREW